MSEQDFVYGKRAALRVIIAECLRQLGYDEARESDPVFRQAQYVVEREAAVAVLRRICEAHGDNDWPHNLHLADILEKHLEGYLNADQETDAG